MRERAALDRRPTSTSTDNVPHGTVVSTRTRLTGVSARRVARSPTAARMTGRPRLRMTTEPGHPPRPDRRRPRADPRRPRRGLRPRGRHRGGRRRSAPSAEALAVYDENRPDVDRHRPPAARTAPGSTSSAQIRTRRREDRPGRGHHALRRRPDLRRHGGRRLGVRRQGRARRPRWSAPPGTPPCPRARSCAPAWPAR